MQTTVRVPEDYSDRPGQWQKGKITVPARYQAVPFDGAMI
ncbi:hypothetical protein SAMCFNEI73_Ch0384 [Sinorhizobium americanum]|uniref:Uncharacterized protein n=1 Tax=Sinorhizobium americanum TaxID=194963 RepID=A0A1L3LI31_9HYPH|nr:hypothetical protein SAMCCGM7_Ch0384 [Sinorhizobium americanum CCGM7]APG89716.1 hypothetical protein SAMCFNEI73_Ch0384 [Sinorhizobium americanum]